MNEIVHACQFIAVEGVRKLIRENGADLMSVKEKLTAEILRYISPEISEVLKRLKLEVFSGLEEIRLRAEKPLMLNFKGTSGFVCANGEILSTPEGSFRISRGAIEKSLEILSQNSIYAYQEDIRNGFLTIRGGHRVGICGRVVLSDNEIKNIKDFSALTVRVSREIKGCGLPALKYMISGNRIMNSLVISPPGCGKTTLLRDMARLIGNGDHLQRFAAVGIIDERSEIASCYKGVPQNDVGISTDVLDACPKILGMEMMIRSMAPQVLITDEIGNSGDSAAIRRVINAGVKIIASAHGYSVSDLQCRKEVLELIRDNIFERYIVLSRLQGPGTIEEVADGGLNALYRRKANAS